MTDARIALLATAGLALLALAWSPLPEALMRGPFAGHMVGHMLLVAVAAPLLAAWLARRRPAVTMRMADLCPPVTASLVELVLVWGWHAPVLHQAARANNAAFMAEQASFLLAGSWLWATALARRRDGRLARGPEGILALLLTATHMTLLGVLLALAPRALFAHDHGGGVPSPLADQELGGIVMLVVGGIAYLAGGLYLLAELLQEPERNERRPAPENRRCA